MVHLLVCVPCMVQASTARLSRASPYLAWLSKRRGGAETPNLLARLPVKSWSECLDSYDSMKRAVAKSDLSSSCSFAEGIPPAQNNAAFANKHGQPQKPPALVMALSHACGVQYEAADAAGQEHPRSHHFSPMSLVLQPSVRGRSTGAWRSEHHKLGE